ncbi:MAG: PrgI family protein [Patescibacteria group bacterium]|nr:PrgI family protein [Patescibacteria group bacterium]
MQYKVPQNIDMQDKIIGPLTLIQFLYLMGGGMIIYIAYEAIGPTFVFFIIALPLGLLTFALTFLKIQDQPFSTFLVSLLFYFLRPKTRVWHKVTEQEKFKEETASVQIKKITKEEAPEKHVEKSELEKLAALLDTQDIKKDNTMPAKTKIKADLKV